MRTLLNVHFIAHTLQVHIAVILALLTVVN